MKNMWLNSVQHCVRNLGSFEGRDRRSHFWPYAATIVLLDFVVWFICVSVTMNRIRANVVRPAGVAPEGSAGTDYFSSLLVVMTAIVGITILLLASAVVRRLHDRGSSGWWGLLPIPFLVIGIFGMAMFGSLSTGFASQLILLLGLNNIAYFASGIVLVVMLAWPSEPVENRFGPPPPATA